MRISRVSQILLGAAVLAAAATGFTFLLLHRSQGDPARLLAALDAFTGEWEGDAAIQLSDGKPLRTLHMTRRYSWVGEKQIVETRFTSGAEEYSTRAIQWIENSNLKAIGLGPEDESNEYAGAPTFDGILWTNRHRPKADRLDRIVTEDGQTTIQLASISPLHLGGISDLVGVAAVLTRRTGGEGSVAAATEAPGDLPARITELERMLALAKLEREKLLVRLAEMRPPTTAANSPEAPNETAPARAPVTVRLSRPSRLEIRSSPPGMKYEVRAEDESGVITKTAVASGSTPVTLPALAPGNYAVILQHGGLRKTVHHITVPENVDVFLFHREEGGADGELVAPFSAGSRGDPAVSEAVAQTGQ